MVITIDGPAGAGKSTVARALAAHLDFDYLDTGAMYRAATWKALSEGAPMEDPPALARLAAQTQIEFESDGDRTRVLCDGKDVTAAIRSPKVTANVFRLADDPAVRAALIEQQRRCAQGRNLVTEGRDQGTDAFPGAEVKFYLDASRQVRALRRSKDLTALGMEASLEEVLEQIVERDTQDQRRPVGSLRLAEDMIVIDSTCLTVEQVVAKMAGIVGRRTRADTQLQTADED